GFAANLIDGRTEVNMSHFGFSFLRVSSPTAGSIGSALPGRSGSPLCRERFRLSVRQTGIVYIVLLILSRVLMEFFHLFSVAAGEGEEGHIRQGEEAARANSRA